MSDWIKVSDDDAKRIKSGGQWAYVRGQLVPVSMAAVADQLREQVPVRMTAIADQLREQVPGRMKAMAERLCVESLDEIEGMDVAFSDELDRVTLILRANGHEATDTFALVQPVAH